ncbi:MAG: nucleotidyltransferase family protein [Thermoanaerobaculia bacterium]
MSAATNSFRFDPPAVAVTPELRWVLARAFGPPELAVRETEGLATTVLAARLGLAPRIAARNSPDRLAGELGAEAAAELRRLRSLTVAQEMLLATALGAFDEVAADLRISYSPLKGQALVLGGYAPVGGRPSVDVDLLVPEGKLDPLQRELTRRGFTEVGQRYEHQAPALHHEGGGAIELHRVVLGVRPEAKRSAGFDELVAAEYLFGAPLHWPGANGKPRGDVRMPGREILAAHALVHALAQHGLAPQAYPGLLLYADLLDLAFRDSPGRSMLATITPWIERAVSFEEAKAALDLATALAGGGGELLESAGAERPPARRLLDHCLAGAFDSRYAESLKARALEQPLSDRSPSGARAAAVAGALVPGRGWVADGSRESIARYVLRLLGRPFDLVRRWRRAKAAGRRN